MSLLFAAQTYSKIVVYPMVYETHALNLKNGFTFVYQYLTISQ